MKEYDIDIGAERIVGSINKEPCKEDIIIKEGIENYIEYPCIEACKMLWNLNIQTFESSGNRFGGWIAISGDSLSDENREIFCNNLENKVEGYSDDISYKGYSGIYVLEEQSEESVSSRLLELANIFKMQDVKEGIYTKDEFLVLCGCCSYIVEDDGCIRCELDPKKVIKPFSEYVEERGAIYSREEDRVYLNNYYLNKHQNYLDYLSYERTSKKV